MTTSLKTTLLALFGTTALLLLACEGSESAPISGPGRGEPREAGAEPAVAAPPQDEAESRQRPDPPKREAQPLAPAPLGSARQLRWLWSGVYPEGTGLISPEMGAGFTVPRGMQAKFEWGYTYLELSTGDGEIHASVWLASDVEPTAVEAWVRADDWKDRAGKPMPVGAEKRLEDGRRVAVRRSDQDVAIGAWKPGPNRAGIGCFIWGSPKDEARMRALQDELLATVAHFPPTRTAKGLYGLKWLGWLGGKKLVKYETYSSSPGSGYASKWRIDLCADGSFTQSSSFSMSFGELGSASGYDPSRGAWGIEAGQPNALTLIMQAQGGTTVTYSVSYDSSTERTFLGSSRYFRVPNEWCELARDEPALPAELIQMLGRPASLSSPGSAAAERGKAAPAKALDGTWIASAAGYSLSFSDDRYTFHVHDDASGWVFVDAGRLERAPNELIFRSDDGEVERYAYRLQSDVLVIALEGEVTFSLQR